MKKKIEALIKQYRAEARKARQKAHKLSNMDIGDIDGDNCLEIAEDVTMYEERADVLQRVARELGRLIK
jgi:hypothetical protein